MEKLSDSQLYKNLEELGIIDLKKLKDAGEYAKTNNLELSRILLDRDLISEDNLYKIIADIVLLPYVNLREVGVDEEVLKSIPEVYSRSQMAVAFKRDSRGLHLAVLDPDNSKASRFISKKMGVEVVTYLAGENQINFALSKYKKDIKSVFNDLIKKASSSKSREDPSIIKIVDTIVIYAYENFSSDIHIEPMDEKSLVRYRIDGILHDIVEFPKELHEQLITRIKVLAKLRTDEHYAAQDGKIVYKLEAENLDIRVSIVPITDGEKVVMRILSEKSRQFSLKNLGFSDADLGVVEELSKKPHGMILSTGPTGSGKTTTLYAILKILNRRDVNIMTIEDPVEYDVEGINQIQVNPKTELTFSKGLRSIVRQDPDIILVGEIRDEETADISVNAAMTGHMVLSTLHTNDASTAIPRLLDMNIEPFLVASTVNLIIAQRLVRKICDSCRVSVEINKNDSIASSGFELSEKDKAVFNKYFTDDTVRIYRGKGCKVCHSTGYLGRIGIFELLIVNEKIREAILKRSDSSTIQKTAVGDGMKTMLENGLEKVKEGLTTIEEVLRVIKE